LSAWGLFDNMGAHEVAGAELELSGEDFTLVCGRCGTAHRRKLAWVQLHSELECESCGARQRIDKDAAMIELATGNLAARADIGP
jgi:Zn finger protein HypA/HybF involved in hydrogenase expression